MFSFDRHFGFLQTLWDLGGQHKIRPLWKYYYQGVDAIIFVVDSADRSRFAEAAEELHHLLAADELRHASVLVMANKQDAPGAASLKDVASGLGLSKERGHPWHVQATTAVTGDGLYEGLDWMANAIKEGRRRARS